MKIGKVTAIFLSAVFFFIIAGIIAVSIGSIFENFSFAENPIIRIVFLLISFFITRKFYDYIYTDVKVKEGKNDVAVYSDNEDKRRKIAVGLVITVLIVFIAYISVSVLYFSESDDGNSNELTVMNFNNSNISFNYSSNWIIRSNNSTDIVLVDIYGNYLYISNYKTDGYSLDGIYNLYKSEWESNKNISIVNYSNIEINGVPAIETYLNISSPNLVIEDEYFSIIASFFNIKPSEVVYTNSYEVLIVNGDRYYSITYDYTGDLINEEEFKVFINSLKFS